MTTWGIPTHLFLQIHVVISLIALVSGLVALYSWINNKNWNGWTALFLVTIILTSITGYRRSVSIRPEWSAYSR
jgi:hypothetical protein